MASVSNDPGGRRRILFVDAERKRRCIRLGKVTAKQAETVRLHVEHLAYAKTTGTAPDGDTARWVASLADEVYAKLAAVGLVTPRQGAGPGETLGPFLDAYFAERRVTRKAGTLIVWRQTRRCLIDYFGDGKPLKDITPGDADAWREHLLSAPGAREKVPTPLSVNTVRRRCGLAKQFFRAAVRRRLIPENPFDAVDTTVRGNRAKDYFVSREEAAKVLDACPDAEWRLLFAFSRFGGLRCPSEHLALKWGDIDWERGRIRVTSPKTAHHDGKAERIIPLFPELRPLLEAAFDAAPEGSEYVVTRWRDVGTNRRTHLLRIIRKAGLTPWPKLFHNLRASRQTELAAEYPIHVVCEWIGNTQAVAKEHYLRVTDADYDRATSGPNRAAQNPAQYPPGSGRKGPYQATGGNEKTPGLPGVPTPYDAVRCTSVGAAGFEPATSTV